MATGINFRQTSGYVTDGASDTYCLGEAYPTTRGGLTFGFPASAAADMRNRATSVDARLAGGYGRANASATVDFRLDLPAPGQYDISLALGDANHAQNHRVLIKDNATTLHTINVATPIAEWADATGATYEFSPAWVSGQTPVRLTFASTTLILTLGGHSSATLSTFLAHLKVTPVGDTTPPTITGPTGTGGTLACSGSVSTNEANGTLYAVVTASSTAPSAGQVKAGQDHTGAATLRVVSQSVTATGVQSIASGAVTAGTRYWHFMHEDAAANASAVASSAAMTVTASGPTINTQPSSQTVTAPATATFTVAATASAGALSYQWQRQPTGGGGYTDISGANAASYTTGATAVTGGSHNNGDTYRCVVTDSNGSTTSSAATLNVGAALAGFDLSGQVFRDNTGTPIASAALTLWAINPSTGALVAAITGYSTNASGIVTTRMTHASLVATTQYRVAYEFAGGQYGVAKLTAT